MKLSWVLILPLFLNLSCGFQPEDPGLCKLQCSSAIISGNEPVLSIKLKSAVPKTSCPTASAGANVEGLRADFLVGEAILDQKGSEVGIRPVPNISIEPVVVGQAAKLENGETNPAYQGVRTPRDNWCSDACGVVSMQVVGVCPAAGTSSDLSVQLHSGALYGDAATFPIETQAPVAAGLK